eukprot:gene20673-31855_t
MDGILALPGCLGPCREFSITFPEGFFGLFGDAKLPRQYQWVMGGTRDADIAAAVKETQAWMDRTEPFDMMKNCWIEAVMGGVGGLLDVGGRTTAISLDMRESRQYHICLVSWNERKRAVESVMDVEKATIVPYSPLGWVYWNEAHHDFEGEDSWKARYYGSEAAYRKLVRIKRRYNPTNFLTCYHCVGWNLGGDVDPRFVPCFQLQLLEQPHGRLLVLNTSI